jgi:hypothetical protein
VPGPPSLRIVRPAGKVPRFNPGHANMVGRAGETTLDVEYAHAVAPGAKIMLAEPPGGGTSGTVSSSRRPGHDQRPALRARTGPRRPLALAAEPQFTKMAEVTGLIAQNGR